MIHNIAQGNRTKSRRTKDVDVEPSAGAGDNNNNQSASPDTGDYGESDSNSEIEFSEDDEDTLGGKGASGPKRKPVPSKLVLKAARARRARQNKAVISKDIGAVDVENDSGKA